MREHIRRCFRMVNVGSRHRWPVLIGLALVVSVVEATGAALIFSLLAFVSNAGEPVQLPIVGDLSDRLPDLGRNDLVAVAAGIVALFFVLRGVVSLANVYLQGRVAENTGAVLASRLMYGYLRLPYEFHLQRNSAELLRNVWSSVAEIVGRVLVPVVSLISELFIVIAILAVLFVTAPAATALAIAVLAPTTLLLLKVVQPRIALLGEQTQLILAEVFRSLQEGLTGVRDIKVLGRELYFQATFAEQRLELARRAYLRSTLVETPRLLIETVIVLLVLLFVVFGARNSSPSGDTVAVLGLFAYAVLRLLPSLNRIVTSFNNFTFAGAAIDDVYEDLELIIDTEPPVGADDGTIMPFERELRLSMLTYRYEPGLEAALEGIDLTIRRGESVGIVGPTGGGKSTLLDCMLGLLTPTGGAVLVDGRDIREDVRAWQRNIGAVHQTIFLVDGTLRRNIAFGVPDTELDEAKLHSAISNAQLEEMVAALPHGLDTRLGERGVRLSGGQRQRVAIARALYRSPELIVFDEATSALDNTTEAELMGAVDRLRADRTIVIVAHRLSTVRRCDRIIVIEGGRVTGEGRYDELLADHVTFRRFAK